MSEELPINQLVRIVKDAWVYIKLKEQTDIDIIGAALFKVSLLWFMKGSYFGFGILNNSMHARSKKHFHCLIICIYFLPYLLNDSQTIHLTIHFFQTPPLCDAALL